MKAITRQFTKSILCLSLAVVLSACTANKEALSKNAVASDLGIHINQLAYDIKGTKSALVVSSNDTSLTDFVLRQNDETVWKGTLSLSPEFDEWGAGKHYYKADFSDFNRPGRYTLVVLTNKNQQLKSATFEILQNAYFTKTATDVIAYFKANRYNHEKDRNIRIYDTDQYADVFGGWMDAGGDTGKYLSHLSYANFMNPQQGAIASWAMAKSYESIPKLYEEAGLEQALLEETLWGADYLHRILDDSGAFYMTVFDQWGYGPERVITAYTGLDGAYTPQWQAAYREGGGIAIAALARAYGISQTLGKKLNYRGEFSADQYLADAEKAFAHLQANNEKYCDNGVENIIDDYTALIAATELYRVTKKEAYLQAMQHRVDNLNKRITNDGWFVSDDDSRPYYHAVEAGMPVLALVDYLKFAKDQARIATSKHTIEKHLKYQLSLNNQVSNPFNYARQTFKAYLPTEKGGVYGQGQYAEQTTGFFIPHANETGYWWQGESARLASLSAAAIWGGQVSHADLSSSYGIAPELEVFAQNQMDWILGRNPYDMCMLYGFGVQNPPYSESGGSMVKGGISNGITGATASAEGRGITWAEGPESNNWRWVEQWLQHSTWYLLAVTAMSEGES